MSITEQHTGPSSVSGRMSREQRRAWAEALLAAPDGAADNGRLGEQESQELERLGADLVAAGVSEQRLTAVIMSMAFMLVDLAIHEVRPEIPSGLRTNLWLRYRNRVMVRELKRTSTSEWHGIWDRQSRYFVPMFWGWRDGNTWQEKWCPTWRHRTSLAVLRSMRASLLRPSSAQPNYQRIPRRVLRPTGFVNEWLKQSRGGEDANGLW
jgi:hypothetical protein